MIHVIDLDFQAVPGSIASFLVESSEGPILIESGPYSTFPKLKDALKGFGYVPADIGHVLLTHIHFDHAGAAWKLAESGAKIYVHPVGAPHMINPEKLYNSAKRIYQDRMETLWGKMEGIDPVQVISPKDNETIQIGDHSFRASHTPGHAHHHIAWQLGEAIFAGDVAGVKIGQGPVMPPCPPPEFDQELWLRSIEKLEATGASSYYLTHFGVHKADGLLSELKDNIQLWAGWVKKHWEAGKSITEMEPEFQAFVKEELAKSGVSDAGIAQYEAANPSFMSVSGLARYWKKKVSLPISTFLEQTFDYSSEAFLALHLSPEVVS